MITDISINRNRTDSVCNEFIWTNPARTLQSITNRMRIPNNYTIAVKVERGEHISLSIERKTWNTWGKTWVSRPLAPISQPLVALTRPTFPEYRERSTFMSPREHTPSAQFECGFRSRRSEKQSVGIARRGKRRSKSLKLETERNFPRRLFPNKKKNRQ